MKVIKAFAHEGTALVSSYATGVARKVYTPFRWNYPPLWLRRLKYGIVCFESIEDVDESMFMAAAGSVWECEAATRWALRGFSVSEHLAGGKIYSEGVSWPRKTIMVAGIKPIRRLFSCSSQVGEAARRYCESN